MLNNKKAREYLLNHIPKNSVGAEIGVHLGNYSEKIISISNPKKLYLIDPWKTFDEDTYSKSWYGRNTKQQEMDQRYDLVCSKFKKNKTVKVLRNTSKEAAKEISDESLDFVYIDGDHTFEGCCLDFDLFFPKIKKGGFIYGDDYLSNNWWGTGVIDALHKNLYEKNLVLIFLMGSQFCCKKI